MNGINRAKDINRATENLLGWSYSEEWEPRLLQFQADHLNDIVDAEEVTELELTEILGDAAHMLNVFIVEDFFTARFGARGELNVIDAYLKRHGWRESVLGRRYLEGLRDSTVSLYEVGNIDPGRSLTVRDLLVPGKAITVQEQQGSQGVSPWDHLAARVVAMDGVSLFAGGVLRFRHEVAAGLVSLFDEILKETTQKRRRESPRRARSRRKRRRKSRTVPPTVRETVIRSLPCVQILARFWLKDVVAAARAPLPELRNTDDEAMVFCEVQFPIFGDEAQLSAALDGIEPFERDEDSELHWVWSAPGSPSHRLNRLRRGGSVQGPENAPGNTILGHAKIGAGVLTLSVNSRERAELGQALLSTRLGRLVGQPRISSQDPDEVLQTHRARPQPQAAEPTTEEETQAIHEYLDEHYLAVLDEPLPLLGGRTLREAAATKEHRKGVIDWIKQLENMEHHRAAEQGQAPYDTSWIWQALGLQRPR